VRLGEPDPGLRVAVPHSCLLGESPFWHPTEQRLYLCDIPGKQVLRHDPQNGQLERWDFDTEPGAIAPLADGRLLVALRSGIATFDPASGQIDALAKAPYDTATQRFNDGKCDARGRLWVGTIVEPREPALGSMQCYQSGVLSERFDGVSVSNGRKIESLCLPTTRQHGFRIETTAGVTTSGSGGLAATCAVGRSVFSP